MTPRSDATKAKISAAFRGKPKSAEHRARISAAMRARLSVPEIRAKMAANRWSWPKGKPLSDETKAKIGAANKGNRSIIDAPIKGECVYCFEPATTYDHVVPRGRPGWDDPDNRVICCLRCNRWKSELQKNGLEAFSPKST